MSRCPSQKGCPAAFGEPAGAFGLDSLRQKRYKLCQASRDWRQGSLLGDSDLA